jgi:hypothetical protein
MCRFNVSLYSQQFPPQSWDDVPLTLETSTPTFGLGVPQLPAWNLDIERYFGGKKSKSAFGGGGPEISRSRKIDREMYSADLDVMPSGGFMAEDQPMEFRGASVTSKGNFSATFRVPGLVSIPSDGEAHNFTIVQLILKAEMSWVSVPKVDTKAHINVREFCFREI